MDNIIVNSALWYAEQSSQFLLNSGANKLLDKGYDYYVKEFIPLGHRLIQNGQIAADAMDGELAAQFSMAYEMTTFFGDAVNAAADDFTNDDEDDSTIKFDGTVDEFRQELANRVLITLSLAFEHEFINFTEQTGISRAQYEILAAEYIAHAEDDGSKVSEMFKGDSSEKHKSKGWTNAMPKNKRS